MPERKTTSTNFINQNYLETKCALNELIHLLSKRWLTEVLFSIEAGNSRFSSIKEDLKYISDHILADRLKILEETRFIAKRAGGTDQRMEYVLTDYGNELSNILDSLCHFADQKENSVSAEKATVAK